MRKVGIKMTDLNSQSYEPDGLFYDISLKSLNVPDNPQNLIIEPLNARLPDRNPIARMEICLAERSRSDKSMMNNSDGLSHLHEPLASKSIENAVNAFA